MPGLHRRSLVLAALSLLVALVATLAAMSRQEPEIGLATGRSPQAQELYLRPGTTPTMPDPPSTTPTTAPSPTTTAAIAPGTTPTAAGASQGEPVGCVPGTFDERHAQLRLEARHDHRSHQRPSGSAHGRCLRASWSCPVRS